VPPCRHVDLLQPNDPDVLPVRTASGEACPATCRDCAVTTRVELSSASWLGLGGAEALDPRSAELRLDSSPMRLQWLRAFNIVQDDGKAAWRRGASEGSPWTASKHEG
jgi:hypothetical protein